jgi:membrane fusion protein (multidrug efflux system)
VVKARICILLGILLLAGCGGQDQGADTEIVVPVTVEEVKAGPIEEFILSTGTVYSTQESLQKSEMTGYYEILKNPKTGQPFRLGDFVDEGQAIIRLNDEEHETNVKLASQKLNLDISKQEYEKQQSLYEKGGVTLRDLKNAELAYVNAKYAYANALIQIAKMTISAPFYGVIVDMPYYTQGTRITSGSDMVKIMNYSKLYMEANLPAKELPRIIGGQMVRVMNYTLPDDTLMGQITQVSPAINPDTRAFKASLVVSNPDWLLRPGMFVKAELIVARRDSALVIPKNVILSKQRGKTVFIAERGAAQERVVVTGLENPDKIEVVEGLSANDRLIVKGFETLRNRSKVKIIR